MAKDKAKDNTKDPVNFSDMVIGVPDNKAKSFARPGSQVDQRHAILLTLDGKTVKDYYKSTRDAGVPCTANNPRKAAAKGLITLTEPKS